MKKGLTELVFILDRSGSMSGLEKDTIGGYNAMLEHQKSLPGEAHITTVLFSTGSELLHDRTDIRGVRPITEAEYCVGGSTALLDAIGRTIHKIGEAQKHTDDAYRAEKVLFVIITDGEENASRYYTLEHVRQMIERQKARYNWEFVFLGANIDAEETANRFGIGTDRAQSYLADSEGVNLNFEVMNANIASFRKDASMPSDWKEQIARDYVKRGGRKM